jgi:hypothetical protein
MRGPTNHGNAIKQEWALSHWAVRPHMLPNTQNEGHTWATGRSCSPIHADDKRQLMVSIKLKRWIRRFHGGYCQKYSHHFEGIYSSHIRGRRVSEATNRQKAFNNQTLWLVSATSWTPIWLTSPQRAVRQRIPTGSHDIPSHLKTNNIIKKLLKIKLDVFGRNEMDAD